MSASKNEMVTAPAPRAHGPRVRLALLSAIALSSVASSAAAQLDLSAAVRGGTLGVGVEADLLLTSHLGVRAGYNGLLSFTTTQTNSGITYDGKLDLVNIPLLVDFYLSSRGTFHLTGGMILNKNKVTATGVPDANGNYVINNVTYSETYLGGPPVAVISYPSTAWYAGLGWGTPAHTNSRWGIVFDLGVMIATPKVGISVPDPTANAAIQANLQAQMDSTQAALKKYATYWPVIQLGVSYSF